MMAIRSVGLPTIWNPLDPPGSIADSFRDAYRTLEEWLGNFLANPPRYSDRGILPDLYAVSSITAQYIVFWAMLLVVMVGVALMRGRAISRALLTWAVVSVLSPVFVQLINAFANTGGDLTVAMNFYTAPERPDPVIDSAMLGIIIFGINAVGAFALSSTVVSYEAVILLVKFWGPIAFSIWGLGKRARQITEIIIALGLVATLLGRPVAQFILEIGQLLRASVPGGNTLVLGGILIMISLGLAIISQIVLVFACYKGVQEIEGRIGALVKGTAVTTVKNTIKVDINKMLKRQRPPQPVYTVASPNAPSARRETAHRVGRSVGRKASTVAGAAATAAGQPVAGAVIAKGGNHKFREKRK